MLTNHVHFRFQNTSIFKTQCHSQNTNHQFSYDYRTRTNFQGTYILQMPQIQHFRGSQKLVARGHRLCAHYYEV